MMPPVFCSGPHPPAAKPVPHAALLNMQGGKDGATANIPTKPRLTGDVLLQAGFCRCHYRLCFRPRIEKMVASTRYGMISALRTVRRSATGRTFSPFRAFSTTSSRSFLLFRRLRGWGQSAPPLQAPDWLHWHPPPDRRRFGHEIHKRQLAQQQKALQRLQAHTQA